MAGRYRDSISIAVSSNRGIRTRRERGTCDERVFRGSCSHVKYLSEDSKIRQTTRWNKRRRNLFLSLSPDSFERRCSEDPEGKHQVFLPRPFSIKTDPSILEFPFFRERKREREKRRRKLERQRIVSRVQIKRSMKDGSFCFA